MANLSSDASNKGNLLRTVTTINSPNLFSLTLQLSNSLKLRRTAMTSSTSSPDVPPFHGYVETTVHALRLIHAARQGIIPRITRRLNDAERRAMVKSGAVFIFSVEESGIKRWTDGLLWSPSRIVGNFLVYREINERASSRGSHKKYTGDERALSIHRNSPGLSGTGFKGGPTSYSSGSDQGTFKPNGLIKKTITVTIDGSDLHLISYYTSEDIRSGRLKKPSSRQDIMNLYMPPHIFRLTNFRVPPKVEMGPDGKPRLVSEPEDDVVECKVEEQSYSPTHSASPTSPVSPVDSYTTGSLYPLSPLTSGSNGYSRSSAADKWNGGSLDSLRMSAPSRQDTPWPLSPTSSHTSHVNLSSRRDALHADAWSTHGVHSTNSGRWQSDSYEAISTNPELGLSDRPARTIRSGHPYQNTVREHHDGMGYNTRYLGRREGSSQRTPWLMNSDVPPSSSSDSKSIPRAYSYCSPSQGMSSSIPEGFHSWGSGWTSGDGSMNPTSYSSPPYTTGYATSDAAD
ncbi:hypothetical protein D9758_012281 [Tetrapyrgos nigripes]|uniref:Uncharacterized protein n=1 Tax=Tetrapyrgos nigripes TaxID=182062 RepID=A0A8H5CGD9_9AGAR|nr:hypothetical protein D9758_012281 [Tetrapyrgos nigripes]